MADKPSVLFLVILGVAGSVLFSRFAIEGIPAIVFVIPLAIIAFLVHDADAGVTTGLAIAVLNGILIERLRDWDIVAYALAAGITVYAYQATYPQNKSTLTALAFAVIGSLVYILFNDFLSGENIVFRDTLFWGTFAIAAHVMAANVIITLLAHGLWVNEKK